MLILHFVLQALWYVIPTDYKTVIINVNILHSLYIQNRQVFLILLLGIVVCYLTQVVFDLLILQLSLVIYLERHSVLADVVRETFVCGVELGLCSWVIA